MIRGRTIFLLSLLGGCVGDVPIEQKKDAGPDAIASPEAGPDSGPAGDVSVSVVDSFSAPVAGAYVAIGGASCTTAADGRCTITNAPGTYDATVAYPSPLTAKKRVTAFLGLTTRTPTLEAIAALARASDVTLSITGPTFPLPAGDSVRVVLAPMTHSSNQWFLASNAMTTYPTVSWLGENPDTGKASGFLVSLQNGLPTAWKSQSTPVAYTLTDGMALAQPINLTTSVTTKTVGGTVNASGTGVNTLNMYVAPPGVGAMGRLGFLNANVSGAFSASVPVGSTTNFAFGGTTSNNKQAWVWKANVLPGATNVDLTIPTSLVALQSPMGGATGVDTSTQFSWTGSHPASLLRVFCPPGAGPYVYAYEVLTMGSSAPLRDTSNLGAPIPSGASCVWIVTSFAGASSPDDFVQPAGWSRFTNTVGFAQDGAMTQDGRLFTTK